MGWRGTLVLCLLVAVAGFYLWFEEVPPEPRPAPRTLLGEPASTGDEETAPLLEFDPAKVASLQFRHGGETRETKRTGASWEGIDSSQAMEDFLASLAGLARIMEVSNDPAALDDYGLRPPASVLEIRLQDPAEPLVLEIGNRNPATTGVYARVNRSGPILLAGALVAWEFEKAFAALAAPEPA